MVPDFQRCHLIAALIFVAAGASAWAQTYAFTTLAGHPPYASDDQGYGSSRGSADGQGDAVRFYGPHGLAMDVNGSLFVADKYNHTVRKITREGVVSTLAGLAGSGGGADGIGSSARFFLPEAVVLDVTGNLIVADAGNNTIRRITPGGVVTTIAGPTGGSYGRSDGWGSMDGLGNTARFLNPEGLAIDQNGNLIVADSGNHTIRRISPNGTVTTLAGMAGESGGADGAAGSARFNLPTGLAIDAAGNLFVADTNNNVIRKIAPGGTVTTVAGRLGFLGVADGPVNVAGFNRPRGVAVDGAGNVFVADGAIRKISPDGFVTTIGAASGGGADGTGSAAGFAEATGVAVDRSGYVFVADRFNNTIRKGVPAVVPGRIINFSILAALAGDGEILTMGTIIGGAGTSGKKPLLVRAVGPSLAPFGVSSRLEDPYLEFFSGPTKVLEVDNWGGGGDLVIAFAQLGAFPFTAASSKDAALNLLPLPAGNSTARVSSTTTSGGSVLAELYDATPAAIFTPATPRLINVSVLKNVGAGLTAGFIIGGTSSMTVLIRAVGPSLAVFSLRGLLADPRLEVFDGQSRSLATNDNWGEAGALATATVARAFTQVGAFVFTGSASKDAAMLVTLTPGRYTAQVRSADSTTGTVLVEVYEVP
jgi:hypothetical protein